MDSTNASFSIEFYPPRTAEGNPCWMPCTPNWRRSARILFGDYGAGGSTRAGTSKLVLKYRAAGSEVAPHLSFAGTDESDVRELLQSYQGAGIKRLVRCAETSLRWRRAWSLSLRQ